MALCHGSFKTIEDLEFLRAAAPIVVPYLRGRRRLRRIARACQDYGQRVQFSVFECEVTPGDWVKIRARLMAEMDEARDSIRFYSLGADGKRRIEHAGNRKPVDLDGALIF